MKLQILILQCMVLAAAGAVILPDARKLLIYRKEGPWIYQQPLFMIELVTPFFSFFLLHRLLSTY